VVDLFEEVEEQLRSDRYKALLRRIAPWVSGIFGAVVLAYLAYWGFNLFVARNLSSATTAYQKGVDALAQNDAGAASSDFQAAARSASAGYRSLALMQEGGLSLAAGKPEAAVGFFDQAAKAAPNRIFGDLARLRAAEAILDAAPYPQLKTRLAPLAASGRPYTFQAREALAMARLLAGRTSQARADFRDLSTAIDAPQDVVQRASLAVELIDEGEAPAAVAAVKASLQSSATMPPPAAASVQASPSPAAGRGGPPPSPAGAAP